MERRFRATSLALTVVLAAAGSMSSVAAQTISLAPRVEFWGAVSSRVDRIQRIENAFVIWSIAGFNIYAAGRMGLQVLFDRTPGQVDLAGPLTNMSMAINAIARVGPSSVSATVSGGPAFYRVGGDVVADGDTVWTYDVAHVVGFNVGGDVTVPVGPHAALFVGCRYFGGPPSGVARRSASVNSVSLRSEHVAGSRAFLAVTFRP